MIGWLRVADEFARSPDGVLAADEVIRAEIVVGLVSAEHVEDRHEDAVLDGDEGLGVVGVELAIHCGTCGIAGR